MPPRASLQSFLATARTALKTPPSQRSPLTFVVGNESADLDSLCCAVVYAYIRTQSPPHTLHIPISNLPRADLALRTEMIAVLRRAGLSPSDLLTLSELPDLKPEETRWLLVDHNALTGPLKKYSDRVVGCIDHHVDEGAVSSDANPRVVEPCGSCMSLIVDESRAVWDAMSKEVQDSDAAAEDDKLAKLALAPILIDTINLTAKDKIREKDPRSVTFLEGKLTDKPTDLTKFFDEITAVKEDISQLSFRDIFRKDYKEWEEAGLRLGVSCVVQGFEYLLERADGKQVFLRHLSDWADERKLDVASVMTTLTPDGQFQRQLLVWARTDSGTAALKKFVDIGQGLKLKTWNGGELGQGEERLAWEQGDLTGSRKQVAPLLREALKAAGSHL